MSIFSKLFNAFKSIQLNDRHPVTGQALDQLLVGSMYAEQQSAFLNSYETGMNKSDVKTLVEDYWGIYNRQDAFETLQSLHLRNQDTNLDVVYKAFEDPQNYVEILKAGLPDDQEALDYYVNVYRNLNEVVPELIEQQVVSDFSQLKRTKDSGWNFGRGVFLARCCYELGYLSENELKEYIAASYTGIKNYCKTWQEYTTSYIFGRALSGGANNGGMIQIAHDLHNNDRSPLKGKTYL